MDTHTHMMDTHTTDTLTHTHTLVTILKGARSIVPGGVLVTLTTKYSSPFITAGITGFCGDGLGDKLFDVFLSEGLAECGGEEQILEWDWRSRTLGGRPREDGDSRS